MSAHHHLRYATATTAIVTIVACSFSRPAAAQQNNNQPTLRVRSNDASIARLKEQAVTRSPTFKRLVATIQASNGIIYIEAGVCPGRMLACLPVWMISSGGNRFMRIVVDRQRLDSDKLLAGAIAHELQHAIEVLSDRFVTDSTKLYFFYRRHAPTAKEQFETAERSEQGSRLKTSGAMVQGATETDAGSREQDPAYLSKSSPVLMRQSSYRSDRFGL